VTPSTKAGYLFLFGNLEIRGVSKPISFPFQALPNGSGYTFTGSFTINRRDYGVGGSSISISDEVKIDLKIAAVPAN
jgi:polyisoprenoid-binding protein YceI